MLSALRKTYFKSTALVVLLFSLILTPFFFAKATSINRNALVNLAAKPGETIKIDLTLEGTSDEDRSGFWYTNYKEIEGDTDKMDITSWITVKPEDFEISQGEIKNFTFSVKVPRNAEPGLWGATSKEAGQEGHASERRTYLVFKDTPAGGNVYSGLLIPVSVKVLESGNLMASATNFIMENIIIIVLSGVIIVLVIMQILKGKKKKLTVAR